MLKRLILLHWFLFLLYYGQAQQYPFTVFNTTNGLVNNRCGNISQDSAGYIWIGTDNGICNYDGRKFNFFPGHFNNYYFAHSQPTMYKGHCILGASNGGLAKCTGNQLQFIIPSKKNNGHIISALAINDSTYLIARTYGCDKLLLKKGNTETEIAVPEAISKKKVGFLLLLQDIEKNIWVTSNIGVMVFIKGDFNKPYVFPSLLDKYNNCIKEDFDNNIFISSGGGVYKVGRNELRNITNAKPHLFYQTNEHIPSIGFLRNGTILLAPMTSGIKVFSKNLVWIKDINGGNGINNTVWDIFTDRENNIWFATDNGLLRLKDIDFIYYKAKADAFTNVISGAFIKNSFIFSNGYSLVKLFEDKPVLLTDHAGDRNDLFDKMLATPDDELWVNCFAYATVSDVSHLTYQYSHNNNSLYQRENIQVSQHLPAPVNMDQSVHFPSGKMLFLTEDGKLYLYQNKNTQEVKAVDNMLGTGFLLIAKGSSNDDIWLLDTRNILHQCKVTQQNSSTSLLFQHNISLPAAISSKCKKIICASNGNVWIGTTTRGILIYEENESKNYVYKRSFTTPDISSVLVTTMLQDSTGNIWIGTNNGIDKITFTKDNQYYISKGVFDNSLSGRLIYFLKEKNNHLYIGTTGSLGIATINHQPEPVTPLVNINHINVNNVNADSLLTVSNVILEPDENNISIEFVALSFINEKQTAYQYKLDGADTSWSTPSPNYMVTYARLKPGDYTFKVRAKNADNVWSEKEALFSFTVKKNFYQHWAFYFLCVGICSGLAYWLYRQKIKSVVAVERTRQHISKDLHDDIGSTLSSITLMNAVLKNKIEKKPDEAARLAEKIEDTSRQMIQNMSDIVWSINPGNDTMDKLQNRLQQFCADVFEDTDTFHKLTFTDALLKKSLPMQLRRDVYLICKEITNNAAKYSEAKNYTLSLSLERKIISIEAIDDGIGFDSKAVTNGNGLNNIRQRIAANNGELILDSEHGTSWHIKIPVI